MTENRDRQQKSALQRGFTLLELLLVMGMGTLLLSLTLPLGLRFYQMQVADEETIHIIQTIRHARSEARLGKNARAFGIHLDIGAYSLFEGTSYTSRHTESEQLVTLPGGATLSSTQNEFIFAPVTGFPNATGTITLSLYGVTRVLEIGATGAITQRG